MALAEISPRRVESDSQRTVLEQMMARSQYNHIGKVDGISIVRRSRRDLLEDCATFALGLRGRELFLKSMRLQSYPEVDNPQAGDLVFYYSGRVLAAHVGVLQEDGDVISKWGVYGHVYKHPILLVPASYGDRTKIVREPIK